MKLKLYLFAFICAIAAFAGAQTIAPPPVQTIPGCKATGYFQTIKYNGRWFLADGKCHPFFARAIYNANPTIMRPAGQDKYTNGSGGHDWAKWADHSLRQMQVAGYNSVEIYYSELILPIATYGRKAGASIQMPFYLYWPALNDVWYHPEWSDPTHKIANVCQHLGAHGYRGYCNIFIDIFDPVWDKANQAEIPQINGKEFTGGFPNSPWVISVSMGDDSNVFAIAGTGAAKNGGAPYVHPAMMIATSDPALYSKQAWVSFLQGKYAAAIGPSALKTTSLDRLNAAWGSNYASWDAVLHEDGSGKWFGSDYYTQKGQTDELKADEDAFLTQIVKRIYEPQAAAIRSVDKNHMLSCGSFGGVGDSGVRPAVMQAVKSVCNLMVLSWDSTYTDQALATNAAAYDAAGIPVSVYWSASAQADSPYAGDPKGHPWFHGDYPTQAKRGQQYAADLAKIFSAQGANGDYYVVGLSMWSLADKDANERTNEGLLVSINGNLFDGKCAVKAPSTDQWGYPCGGEIADFGDFVTPVASANADIQAQFGKLLAPQQRQPWYMFNWALTGVKQVLGGIVAASQGVY